MTRVSKTRCAPLLGGLVIERKAGQAVHIGDDVTVVVTRCGDGRCRLRIEAPRHIKIKRDELGGRGKPLPSFVPERPPSK